MSTSPQPIEIVTPQPRLPAPCPDHPHCLLARCQRFFCSRPIHVRLRGPGRLRQFCSTRCRVAQHRFDHSG